MKRRRLAITVTDTLERRNLTYHNPPGMICGRGDTRAFPEIAAEASRSGSARAELRVIEIHPALAAAAVDPLSSPAQPRPPTGSRDRNAQNRPPAAAPGAGTAGTCQPSPTRLCLRDGRYALEVERIDQHNGGQGFGGAVPGTDESGYFWFFDPPNVELVGQGARRHPGQGDTCGCSTAACPTSSTSSPSPIRRPVTARPTTTRRARSAVEPT